MSVPELFDFDLRAYLDAGHSQADAARHFGVSEPAIHQRLKRMRHLTSRVIAIERANDVVEEKLSATARLERVQQVIDEELAWAVQEARREGGDRAALADVILKLAGEVRQQPGLRLAISPDARGSAGRQGVSRDCVEAIREESPETARRIVARLTQRRALRPSVDLPTLTGGTDGDLA